MDSPIHHASTAPERSIALWCLVGKDKLLTCKIAAGTLDRSAWLLPRLAAHAKVDETTFRRDVDAFLASLGLDSVRKPMIDLGDVLSGEALEGCLIKIYALALDAPSKPLSAPHALLPLTQAGSTALDDTNHRTHVVIDALAWSGAHLYFSRPESNGRPKDYEVFASMPLHILANDEYFNLWFPEAARELGPLGVEIDVDVSEPQTVLRVSGRQALLDSEIYVVRARLADLARHARGRFWVTQIIDGEESVQDFADPAVAGRLNPAALGF